MLSSEEIEKKIEEAYLKRGSKYHALAVYDSTCSLCADLVNSLNADNDVINMLKAEIKERDDRIRANRNLLDALDTVFWEENHKKRESYD